MSFRIFIIGFPPLPVDGHRLQVKTQPPEVVTSQGEKLTFQWSSLLLELDFVFFWSALEKNTRQKPGHELGEWWNGNLNPSVYIQWILTPCSGYGMVSVTSRQSLMTFKPEKFETFIDLSIEFSMMRIVDCKMNILVCLACVAKEHWALTRRVMWKTNLQVNGQFQMKKNEL